MRAASTTTILHLPAGVAREISARALAGYPLETCGLLLGREAKGRTEVREVAPARNLQVERAFDRYEMDPLDQLRAEERARELGLEVVGVWHSHPDHPARPSETDLAAAWDGWSYVIAAVAVDRVIDLRSWRLRGGRFLEERIEA